MWSFVSTWGFSKQAAEVGAGILRAGGDAMDAAEAGIRCVESDPAVESVGRGGFLNENGELALDAAVMDGNTLKTGAVCAVQGYEHPITIARAVMEQTRHNILVGTGAETFARRIGISASDADYLITETARRTWRQAADRGHDTIGVVALDSAGKIVAATSTSGASMRLAGRVGDSPIIGSGFYAESGVGGAVATGWGEDIMRTCCSFRVVELMRAGMEPEQAVQTVVRTAHERILLHGGRPDCIALVCMNAAGEYAAACNHKGFSFAFAREGVPPTAAEVAPILDKDAT